MMQLEWLILSEVDRSYSKVCITNFSFEIYFELWDISGFCLSYFMFIVLQTCVK